MYNLRTYQENGYGNYVAFVIANGRIEVFKTFKSKRAAENYVFHNPIGIDVYIEVLTFRQAAKEYPQYFNF